jgi:mannose-6-phosphate isomerase-like protein (cupin superfamily)
MLTGEEIEGPNGYRLHFVRNDGEVLEMEATYAGRGDLPPLHLHPSQDEHYVVLEGAVRLVLAGEERRHGAGETFDIPAGMPHQMAGDGPARVRFEVRPALRTEEFFRRLYDPQTDYAALFAEFAPEFRLAK